MPAYLHTTQQINRRPTCKRPGSLVCKSSPEVPNTAADTQVFQRQTHTPKADEKRVPGPRQRLYQSTKHLKKTAAQTVVVQRCRP